jgi:hypothetical protein
MKTIVLGLALASLSAAAVGQSEHRYQLFAVAPGATEFGFVDDASFDRTSARVTYWSLSVYEPPAWISNGLPVVYQMRQRIADCVGRQTKDQIVVARLQNGDERWISLIGRYRPIHPNSTGESELMFVCFGKLPKPNLPAFATTEAAVRFSDAAAARQAGRPGAGPALSSSRP